MRAAQYAGIVALVVLPVAAGAVVHAHPDEPRRAIGVGAGFDDPTVAATPTRTDGMSLLSREELYASVVNAERNDTEAALFYVDAAGSWYDAAANGTVGSPSPEASSAANVDPGHLAIAADERPLFVWRVTAPCGTTVYDASTGRTIVTLPIPGCGGPSVDPVVPTVTRPSTPLGRAPGFGAGPALLAVVIVTRLVRRR